MFFWGWRLRKCGRSTLGRLRASTTTMIWRWVIFFSAIFSSAVAARAGGVSGQVELTNSRDAAVRKHKDYSGVVLWLEPVDHPPASSGNGRRVEMLQKDK